jgi:plasmid stability protein
MADILIKNVPKEVHRKLKEMAETHHRSMTKEALSLLEEAAAHYSPEGVPLSKTGASTMVRSGAAERTRNAKGIIERMAGKGTVKMTTDEIMKLTRGE